MIETGCLHSVILAFKLWDLAPMSNWIPHSGASISGCAASSGMSVLCQLTTDLKSVSPRGIRRTQTLTQLRKVPRCKSDSRPKPKQSLNKQTVAGAPAWCCRSEYKAGSRRAGKRASLDLTDSFQNTSSETFWSDSTASPRRSREKLSDCLRFSWRFKYDFLHSSNSDWSTK